MRMPIIILIAILMVAPAAAACRSTPNGGFNCIENVPNIGDDPKPRRKAAEPEPADDYGTPTYYSDGTYGYSLGDGQQWRERYKGDRQGVTGYRY